MVNVKGKVVGGERQPDALFSSGGKTGISMAPM
jgi:hypothetical protein